MLTCLIEGSNAQPMKPQEGKVSCDIHRRSVTFTAPKALMPLYNLRCKGGQICVSFRECREEVVCAG
jgi:hypothetical protein